MAFDAAGNLLVAETGSFDAAASGSPPIVSNQSGRVLRVTPNGQVAPIRAGLPFTHYSGSGIDVGVSDVAMIGGTLYVLTGEGYDPLSRSVLRAPSDGPIQPVANILNFTMAGSTLGQMMGANAVPANPYAIVAAPDGSELYVADGAAGRVLRVGLDGSMRVFTALPKLAPLTGLAFAPDGRLYFADFSALPHTPGSGTIWAADASGKVALAADGLTMPIDVAFDGAGAMYVLEFGAGGTVEGPYVAGGGRLLRIDPGGARTVVLDRLNYPTAMVFSPTGDLYIVIDGAFSSPRRGAVLKVLCRDLGARQACPHRSDTGAIAAPEQVAGAD